MVAVLLGVVVGSAGCSAMSGMMGALFASRVKDCEGFDIPLSVFVGPSRKELRARVKGRGVDHDLPFVVETNADSLVLVGFTPLGTKAFTLVRKGTDVQVESLTGPQVVPPRNVMADVLAMSTPSTCSSTPDGVAVITFESWQISDACTNGRPLKRQISRQPPAPQDKDATGPAVEVDYLEDAIVVRQHRCHYSARYVLQASAPIPVAPAAATTPVPVPVPPTPVAAPPAAAAPPAPVSAPPAAAAPPAPAPAPPASGEAAK